MAEETVEPDAAADESIGPAVVEAESDTEAERVAWVPLSDVRGLIADGKIVNGPTLIGLLHVLSDPGRAGGPSGAGG